MASNPHAAEGWMGNHDDSDFHPQNDMIGLIRDLGRDLRRVTTQLSELVVQLTTLETRLDGRISDLDATKKTVGELEVRLRSAETAVTDLKARVSVYASLAAAAGAVVGAVAAKSLGG